MVFSPAETNRLCLPNGRICPDGRKLSEQPADDAVHQMLISDACHQSMMLLVLILNMFEYPKSYLLALLELICQRFPPYES